MEGGTIETGNFVGADTHSIVVPFQEDRYWVAPARNGTRHFHPNLAEIFDADCSYSGGFDDMPFFPCDVVPAYCSFVGGIRSAELVPCPAVELCSYHVCIVVRTNRQNSSNSCWTDFSSRKSSSL